MTYDDVLAAKKKFAGKRLRLVVSPTGDEVRVGADELALSDAFGTVQYTLNYSVGAVVHHVELRAIVSIAEDRLTS